MILLTCDSCGAELRVPDSMAGQFGRCQNCNARIAIPGKQAPSADATSDHAVAASGSLASVPAQGRAGGQYRIDAITHDAGVVRFGSAFVAAAGWIAAILGAISLLMGLVQLTRHDEDLALQVAETTMGWTQIQGGISLLFGGILLIAMAAFFRMASRVGELIASHIVDSGSKMP